MSTINPIRFLPTELASFIGTEKIDFSVFAKRKQPGKQSLSTILFGLIWTAFTSIFVIGFFGPLFKGEEVHFSTNGKPVAGSLENFEPMLVPALIIGLFVVVGIGMIIWGFYSFSQKGGYFVGTANRLIHYHKGNIRAFDWEQFSGNMEINLKKGDLALQLRTGKMVSRKNAPAEFVPDVVYISGAPDILEIEKICKRRIKENDPTPAVIGKNV
jgi:hypothetical protein